mgnify:CR=1 FL=1
MSDVERRVSSGQSWADFCDALKRAGEQIQRPEAPADAFTRAEGYRYLRRLARAGAAVHTAFHDAGVPVFSRPPPDNITRWPRPPATTS